MGLGEAGTSVRVRCALTEKVGRCPWNVGATRKAALRTASLNGCTVRWSAENNLLTQATTFYI